MSAIFDFGSNGGTVRLSIDVMFCAAVMDFILHRKQQAAALIVAASKECGKVIKGSPNQCYSWMSGGIPNAIQTGDTEILDLCVAYGIDVNKSLANQDRMKIAAVVDAKIEKRSALKEATVTGSEIAE